MSGFDDLARLGVTIRPLSQPVPTAERVSQFSASIGATTQTLAKELRALDAKRIALGLNVRERDIRLDGMLRADARPSTPAVELAFESRFGPLRYATGEFCRWEDNLRAIALSMEALRAVDRYGVSKRGEQYRGWRALTTGGVSDDDRMPYDRNQAVDVVLEHVADLYDRDDIAGDNTFDGAHLTSAIRQALLRTHPDHGGDAGEFRRVMRAKELLEQ